MTAQIEDKYAEDKLYDMIICGNHITARKDSE